MISKEIKWVCPVDKARLLLDSVQGSATCPQCDSVYPIRDGVAQFLSEPDSFYEGVFQNRVNYLPVRDNWFFTLPLWIALNGYIWEVRRRIKPGATVLELGCASGIKYFANRYNMIGLDISYLSLSRLGGEYAACCQADASHCIPLADNSVDSVISSYFWEHIPPAGKKRILEECRRILKKGGKMVFLYDVETQNSLLRMLKERHGVLYRKLFLEKDGHLGYQTIKQNVDIFKASGFKVVKSFGMERTWVQSHSVYSKLAQVPGFLGFIGKCGGVLSYPGLHYVHMLLVLLIDHTFGHLFPESRSRIAISVLEKINSPA